MQSTCRGSKFNQRALLLGASGVSLTKRSDNRSKKIAPPPPVPTWVFEQERLQAFSPSTPTSLIPLDLSDRLRVGSPATTPSMLACYIRVRCKEQLTTHFFAGLEFYYVIHGEGRTSWEGEEICWKSGDLFFLPGGHNVLHTSNSDDCLLYVLNDEPLATFLKLQCSSRENDLFEAVHYLSEDLNAAQAEILRETQESGVIHFGIDDHVVHTSFFPTWKWIVPGEQQIPHRHAAAAVQLFLGGSNSYSMIDGQRVDWQDYTVAISPPGSLHSHHNDGKDLGIYLVTQDFPLHKYLRTYWYEEPDSKIHLYDW
jgi:quercetin dioxygenase-like cupin family protein